MENNVERLLHGRQCKSIFDELWENLGKKYNLKRVDIEVIIFLSKCGKLNTARDIQKYLKLNKGYLSQVLDNLDKKGYITSTIDRSDRRYVHYQLTGSALIIAEEAGGIREKINKRLFSGLTQEEIDCLKEVSKKIEANIEDIIKNGV